MKKYKIGNRIITAESAIAAVRISRMLDSPNTRVKSRDSEIDELTQEEQQAVEDYREAIRNTSNPKLLKIYSHILEEETEHLQELAQAKEVDDACGKMKDDRFSPSTYRKLKELGVKPEQWRKWTQEQASEFIRNKGQKGAEEKAEQKEENVEQKKESETIENNKTASSEKIQSEISSFASKLKLYSDVAEKIVGDRAISFGGNSGEPYVYASNKKKAEQLAAKLSELGLKSAKVVSNGYVHFDFDELNEFRTKLGKPSIAQASANQFQEEARDDIKSMLRSNEISENSAKNVEKILEMIKDKPVSIMLKKLYDDKEGGIKITLFKDEPHSRYHDFELSADETFDASTQRRVHTEQGTTSYGSANNNIAELIEQLSK